ncbi:MAG: hypothetical protein OHK0046_36240 [Anaerolineae bacterium]
MLAAISRLLMPPAATHHDPTGRLYATYAMLISCLMGSLIYLLLAPLIVRYDLIPRMMVTTLFVPLCMVLLWLLHLGQVVWVIRLLIMGVYSIITVAVFTAGGIHAASFSAYIVPVLITGLLLGTASGIYMVLLTMLTGLIILVLENYSTILPPPRNYASGHILFFDSIIFFVVVVLTSALLNRMQRIVTEMHHYRERLELLNQELEQRVAARTAELDQSERRLRTLMDNFPNGAIVMFNHEMRYLTMGGMLLDTVGLSREAYEGNTIDEVMSPDRVKVLKPLYQRALSGESITQEMTFDSRHYYSHFFPIYDEHDQIIAAGISILDISHRVKTEQALRESETRLRAIMRNYPAGGILMFDHDMRYLLADGYSFRNGALTPELMIGKTLAETSQEAYENLHDAYARALRGETIVRDGSFGGRHFTSYIFPVMDENHQISGGCLISQDITERYNAEQALKESEARLRAVMNNYPGGAIMMFGHDLRYVLADGFAFADVRLKPEDIIGKSLHETAPPDQVKSLEVAYLKALQGKSSLVESTYDGRYYLAHVFPIVGEDDQVVAGGVVTQDITERYMAEQALKESEARLRTLMSNYPNGAIIMYDHNLRYIEVDGLGLLDVGLDKERMKGRTIYENFDPDTAAALELMYRHTLSGRPAMQEMVYNQRHYVVRSHPVYDEQRGIVAGVVITQDITERKEAEQAINQLNEELLKQTAQLQAVNKELEAFSYSVSHDLRAPLRAIDGFSQALLEDYSAHLDSSALDYLGRVRQASHRMASLIDDLLGLSRITRRDLKLEPVNLSDLAQTILDELRYAEPHRQVVFEVSDTCTVDCDRGLMLILLQNLLGNAWKFTSKRANARITFGCTRNSDGETVYFVRDNGVGFDMTYVDKLFGAFQRLHRPDEFEGTGIGLATAQRIINKHGGRIWAESVLGEGATFSFVLE